MEVNQEIFESIRIIVVFIYEFQKMLTKKIWFEPKKITAEVHDDIKLNVREDKRWE